MLKVWPGFLLLPVVSCERNLMREELLSQKEADLGNPQPIQISKVAKIRRLIVRSML